MSWEPIAIFACGCRVMRGGDTEYFLSITICHSHAASNEGPVTKYVETVETLGRLWAWAEQTPVAG
jgi:hypothetical protein